MKKIIAKTKLRNYPVIIESGILLGESSRAGTILKKIFPGSEKVVLVTDEKVLSLYKHKIDGLLSSTDKEHKIVTFPDGEKSKNLSCTKIIYRKLLDFNIHRNDLIIAFGGGVIGDLTGFAASTFHRGIKLLHIPTTIISQVDSSIGGKVVVNLNSFKNIIGSFYQPHAVIIDLALLSTLKEKEIINGLAEVLKYGIVFDKKIIELINIILKKIDQNSEKILFELIRNKKFEEIIYRCCKIKTEVVYKDEFDTGLRNLLNFGHTFGHAIEKATELEEISHGEAVAIGMILAIDLSIKLRLSGQEIKDEIIKLYKALKLQHELPWIDPDLILAAIKFDKKFTSKQDRFILLKALNRPLFYCNIDEKIIRQSIEENMSHKKD